MIDSIIDLIEGDTDFNNVLAVVLLYFGIFWFVLSSFVFIDSWKRYNKLPVAIVFFFLVLVFNFPMLIVYLIIRPEEDIFYHSTFPNGEHSHHSGLNVPVVNFIGENGVEMSIQLKISNSLVKKETLDKEVKMNITLEGEGVEEIKVESSPVEEKNQESENKNKLEDKVEEKGIKPTKNISKVFNKIKNKVSNLKNSVNSKLVEKEEKKEEEEKKEDDEKKEDTKENVEDKSDDKETSSEESTVKSS